MRKYLDNKASGHESLIQQHLLQGHTENAERHRELARAYGQKMKEIDSLLSTRMN